MVQETPSWHSGGRSTALLIVWGIIMADCNDLALVLQAYLCVITRSKHGNFLANAMTHCLCLIESKA